MLATIGYEKANLSDFIETLKRCEINMLIDIRERAQSRRPGFSKSALSASLKEAGIGYVHFRALGDPKAGREAARSGNIKLFKKIFNEVMQTEVAKETLIQVKDLALNNNICLMCYERDHRECHRKIVAEHLEVMLNCKTAHRGVQIFESKQTSPGRVLHTNQSATA